MTVAFSFVILAAFDILKSTKILLKVLLSGGPGILIVLNSKEDKVILVQFTEVHTLVGLR